MLCVTKVNVRFFSIAEAAEAIVQASGFDVVVSNLAYLYGDYREGLTDQAIRIRWRQVVENILSMVKEVLRLCGYGENAERNWQLQLRDNENTVIYK